MPNPRQPCASDGPGADRAAENRGVTAPGLQRVLRGDLEAIVAKAMERSLALRYPSVDRLAADISRHLDGHVIEAAPANSLRRARKFIARHKMGAAAAGLIALSARRRRRSHRLGIAHRGTPLCRSPRADALPDVRPQEVRDADAGRYSRCAPRWSSTREVSGPLVGGEHS